MLPVTQVAQALTAPARPRSAPAAGDGQEGVYGGARAAQHRASRSHRKASGATKAQQEAAEALQESHQEEAGQARCQRSGQSCAQEAARVRTHMAAASTSACRIG